MTKSTFLPFKHRHYIEYPCMLYPERDTTDGAEGVKNPSKLSFWEQGLESSDVDMQLLAFQKL